MTILDQVQFNPEFIKMRWQEPYTSAGLNKKAFKTTPRGVYRGFELIPGPGDKEVTVGSLPITGVSGYQGGDFDAASGWNIAVHESLQGYGCNLVQQASAIDVFDLSGYSGTEVFFAIDVDYNLGFPTESQIKVVDGTELDSEPTLVCLGKVIVPLIGPITEPNIVYDDPLYPRVLPYANPFKDGFMSAEQAEIVRLLSVPYASNAYEVEFVVVSSGPQTILIPGANSYVIGGWDLHVFKNGVRMRRGRDYNEIDDGLGFGTSVQWLTNLQVDDRIIFNGQAYAVALTNTLAVLDENALVQNSVTRLNFSGTGVLAIPDGPGKVKVIIPSVAGSGAKKQKINLTGTTIPAYRAVRVKDDGSIEVFDPKNLGHRFYGITALPIDHETYGDVFLDGVALGAIASVSGFSVGDYVYCDDTGSGTFTPTPPDPMIAQVVRVGIADCYEATSGYSAVDIVFDRQSII